MVRTQIYLTKRQVEQLTEIAKTSGKKRNEIIREAIDRLINLSSQDQHEEILRKAAGMWKDREDLPDFGKLRSEWDRS